MGAVGAVATDVSVLVGTTVEVVAEGQAILTLGGRREGKLLLYPSIPIKDQDGLEA